MRNKLTRYTLVLQFVAAGVIALIAGCGAESRFGDNETVLTISGTVRDNVGEPLSRAEIVLLRIGKAQRADTLDRTVSFATGYYHLSSPEYCSTWNGIYRIYARKRFGPDVPVFGMAGVRCREGLQRIDLKLSGQ